MTARTRGTKRKWLRRAVQATLLAGLVLDTTQLRRRLAGLRTLPERPEPASDRFRVVRADGVQVDVATIGAARAHARAEDLSALELVPRDLPVAQAMDLLRQVDPSSYRTDRRAVGAGAWHAVLADDGVLQAVGLRCNGRPLSASELARASAQLKLHASASTDLVVTPRLTTNPAITDNDAELLAALHGGKTAAVLGPQFVWLAGMAASTLLGPAWTALLFGAWSAQPLAVFAGSRSLQPRDLVSYSARRVVAEPQRLLAALSAAQRAEQSKPAAADPVEQRRPAYQADLEAGTSRFFQPRRTDCPWCGSARLVQHLHTTDLFQHKPGRFVLDRCQDCRHIFQNPRLNLTGLDFYYRDFYDGLGEEHLDMVFGSRGGAQRPRAEMLKPFANPESWLDVGTGHGHFCNIAREVWPQTTFDGLDLSAGVELAEQRGWIDRGYRGNFVDLAPEVTESYDVVSMYHYLEHSLDPRRELEAALKVLRPGGHLMIEVPDPESKWGKLLGRWWIAWLQPQHLHFVPIANLRKALQELGFTVVSEHRAEPHDPMDLLAATWNLANHLVPNRRLPWLPKPAAKGADAARIAGMTAAAPVMMAAGLVDRAIAPLARRAGMSNAYRVLARKH